VLSYFLRDLLSEHFSRRFPTRILYVFILIELTQNTSCVRKCLVFLGSKPHRVFAFCGHTGQFKKKVTLLHVYNKVTSEPTITRYTTVVRKTLKSLQYGLPWRRRPETLSRVNYKQTLRVFLTIVVCRVIVGSLVTSLWTCESVTFFLNCPVYVWRFLPYFHYFVISSCLCSRVYVAFVPQYLLNEVTVWYECGLWSCGFWRHVVL
jgi:hypothetical protein